MSYVFPSIPNTPVRPPVCIDVLRAEFNAMDGQPIIGYKKIYIKRDQKKIGKYSYENIKKYGLCVLEIPARAQRVCPLGHKARASYAKVLAIYELIYVGAEARYKVGKPRKIGFAATGSRTTDRCYGKLKKRFYYKVGKTVKPRGRFIKNGEECAPGIHFFVDRDDAIRYTI